MGEGVPSLPRVQALCTGAHLTFLFETTRDASSVRRTRCLVAPAVLLFRSTHARAHPFMSAAE